MDDRAYYNENDEFAAAWLKNVIGAGLIAPGEVDTRSIVDVRPDDLIGFSQCHFFAGIGVWSYAIRSAGWPDERAIWSGSCPCQPFSGAGKGAGFADERHLWPAFHHLIQQRQPRVIVGEQVASPDGLAWLDLVQSDLEVEGYAFAAIDLCAAGFGAPHIRQRLYWLARYNPRVVVDDVGARLERYGRHGDDGDQPGWIGADQAGSVAEAGSARELADADGGDAGTEGIQRGGQQRLLAQDGRVGANAPAGPVNGLWRDADWLLCRDGRWRPVEPGTFPLAHGVASRVGRLRGYGNALVAPVAQAFIEAVMDVIP